MRDRSLFEIDVRLMFAFANYGGKNQGGKREREKESNPSKMNQRYLPREMQTNRLSWLACGESYTRTDSFRGTNAEILGTTR